MKVEIKGLQKFSLIDYPGKLCCTIFLKGCNFRCPYCYNANLIFRPEKLPTIPAEDFFKFLTARTGFLDGVCIGGGEPTINCDLPEFISKIKELGFLVKLDTNGSRPEMIKELLQKRLLDYIAVDIKTQLEMERYSAATGVRADVQKIKETIELVKKSKIEHEFRTTCVPSLVKKEDLIAIARTLKNVRCFALQQFENRQPLDPTFSTIKPYSKAELEEFKMILKPYFNQLIVRA